MELFVIRHTEVDNPENLCYGNIEMPLVKNYEKITKKFFDNLPKNIEKIFSSPSKRCTDLLECMNLEFSKRTELKELDFGDWEGRRWSEINKADLNTWMNDFIYKSPKNGEKMIDLYNRVIDFTKNIFTMNLSKVLFVTHAGVIRALLSKGLEISLEDTFNIKINHDEIFSFRVNYQKELELSFLQMLNINNMEIQKTFSKQ